uniref:Reverse transcriptase Ty1/copia-type domain-containing protein n=1 Tax=Solanum lycopersicum TaxID=4081 RepID=A0A3Q7IH07_SOLLC
MLLTARLVEKAFKQCPILKFHETFSLVVKPTTIKIVLSIAIQNKCKIHQLIVNIAFFQVYVDDIIITRNYATLVTHVINSLAYKFYLKNLGELNYFLGIKVTHFPNGILLSQYKYILEII